MRERVDDRIEISCQAGQSPWVVIGIAFPVPGTLIRDHSCVSGEQLMDRTPIQATDPQPGLKDDKICPVAPHHGVYLSAIWCGEQTILAQQPRVRSRFSGHVHRIAKKGLSPIPKGPQAERHTGRLGASVLIAVVIVEFFLSR